MIHTLNPDCEWDFTCALCGKTVCADNDIELCACTDEPTCNDCCEREHA